MGGLLQKPITQKRVDNGSSERFRWSAVDMQGWRPDMEDEHIAVADLGDEFAGCGLYCVFDGHGGKAVSKFCRLHFAEELRRLTIETGKPKIGKNKPKLRRRIGIHLQVADIELALRQTFHAMDDMLRDPANAKTLSRLVGKVPGGAIKDLKTRLQDAQEKQQKGELTPQEQMEMRESYVRLQKFEQAEKGDDFVADNVGCTAICVLVRKEEVVAANAGDSRALICRAGKAVELSYDHKPAAETEKNRIEAAGGYLEDSPGGARVNGNLNLSRAIGDLEYKKRQDLKPEEQIICSTPDTLVHALSPEDEFMVLACDGVWDVMTNQEVVDFVRPMMLEKVELDKIGEALLDKCISPDPRATKGLGTDNMTALIVQLAESPLWGLTKDTSEGPDSSEKA